MTDETNVDGAAVEAASVLADSARNVAADAHAVAYRATQIATENAQAISSLWDAVKQLTENHNANAAAIQELSALPQQMTALADDVGTFGPVVAKLRGFFGHLFEQDPKNPPAPGTAATPRAEPEG